MKIKLKKEKIMLSGFHKFMVEYRKHKGTNRESGFIRERYENTFNKFPPWDKHPLELIIVKLQYELVAQDYKSQGRNIPEKVLQNYNASQLFDLEGLSDVVRSMVKSKIQQREKRR